uniref:Zinc finger BED domain-containing protein 1-like n=1 Tax=Crassostrea virginica TaxID=6565 RepID=A0A8B8AEX1_CRAVI|nr:zinc finger BED domain-containing protein 1-like [Crassostrea virginica]
MADETRAGTSTDRNNNTSLERQIYSFPGKTKSKVWDYFGFYKVKDGPASKHTLDMSQAICRKCGKKYANKGNTTNFRYHIETEHELGIPEKKGESKSKQTGQTSMDPFINNPTSGKISSQRQEQIDDALCKFIAGKVIPVSYVIVVDVPTLKLNLPLFWFLFRFTLKEKVNMDSFYLFEFRLFFD